MAESNFHHWQQTSKSPEETNRFQNRKKTYFSCFFVNLQRQLSGRRQNQRDGHELLASVQIGEVFHIAIIVDQVQNGHQECGRFARTFKTRKRK
jgi:hypothetical protein